MYLLRNLDLKELVQQNSNHNLLGLAVICAKTENSTKNVESNIIWPRKGETAAALG